MRVPCYSSADSPYPVEWRQFNNLFRGKLKRPRDAEKRDGWVGRLKDEGTIGVLGLRRRLLGFSTNRMQELYLWPGQDCVIKRCEACATEMPDLYFICFLTRRYIH